MHRTAFPAACLAALLAVVLTGCGTDPTTAARSGGGPGDTIQVDAGDTACAVSRTTLSAGPTVFAISNTGSSLTEVYLYGAGDKIVAEKENIGPGISYELTAQLAPGSYEVVCKPGMTGDGIRTPVTVSAAAAGLTVDPAAAAAVTAYRTYVQGQADAMVGLATAFAAAVKAGDVTKAKALYAPSRRPWEAIEPVAEAFGDLDPKVDLREADLEPKQQWTGWHRIEKALWVDGSTKNMGAVADQLVTDVTDLQARVATADLSVASIGNGAKELLDEVATGKITGEEEAFSHTDLDDVAANVAGAAKAFEVLRPLVEDPALLTQLDAGFAGVDKALAAYRTKTGYVSYATVGPAQRRQLAQVVDALGEPLSRLTSAAVG